MNSDQVEAHLRSHTPAFGGLTYEFGRRRDAAFVRIGSVGEPRRWAVVASPGSRWFSVEVPGGFSLDHFDEDLEDQEVRETLDDFVAVAVAFVRSGGTMTRVGRLRFRALVVSTPRGDRTLRRSLIGDIKGLLGNGGEA